MKFNQVEHISIQKISAGKIIELNDQVAVEEPLEIQLVYSTSTGRMQKNIAVTMRTPGNDEELAAGFLFTEGVIRNKEAIDEIKHLSFDENRALVTLHENILPVLVNLSRNFYSTSSCGICGKASIEGVRTVSLYADEKDSVFIG